VKPYQKVSISVVAVVMVMGGCASKKMDPEIAFTPPSYVEEIPSREVEDVQNLGSIYGQGDNPLFADRKAMKVNDILTITIAENITSSSSGSKTLTKNDVANYGGGTFAYAGNSNLGKNITQQLNNGVGLGFKTNTSSNFTGTGTSDRTEAFSTRITARIVKILRNGNYFITGRREMLLNGEKQIIQINGVIRPEDIDQNNQISSTKIADAKILYRTEGDIGSTNERGWVAKALSRVWPF